MTTLQAAFKEWAVVCRALADGRQAIILRKGGTEDNTSQLQLEHTRFWLYPTYLHQKQESIIPSAHPLLEQAEQDRPSAGSVLLSHYAEVSGFYYVRDLRAALGLAGLHIWTEEAISARFAYRTPGLTALTTRIYQVPSVHQIPETPAYAGCRSWVTLDQPLSIEGAAPAISDESFRQVVLQVEAILQPTAMA